MWPLGRRSPPADTVPGKSATQVLLTNQTCVVYKPNVLMSIQWSLFWGSSLWETLFQETMCFLIFRSSWKTLVATLSLHCCPYWDPILSSLNQFSVAQNNEYYILILIPFMLLLIKYWWTVLEVDTTPQNWKYLSFSTSHLRHWDEMC